jgi:signal transduction histidine kinase
MQEKKTNILTVKRDADADTVGLSEQDAYGRPQKALDTILRFSALINSSLNIEDVLNYAMQSAEEFMDAEASTVYEVDEEKGELFVRVARGEKRAPVKRIIRLKLGEGIAGRVVQTGKPRVIQDVKREEDFSDKFDLMTGFTTRSMICVPMILRDKPVGAFQILNKKSGEPFTPADVELVTAMAQQLMVALDNAKLYSRMAKKFELTANELKTAQEKLIRSERLEAMAYLVQGVAHEIRNPVTTIGGFARKIKEAIKEDQKLQRYIQIILEESERLENLVKQVREFSHLLSPEMELGDVGGIVRQVVEEFQPLVEKLGIELVTLVEEPFALMKMDASQLFTALSKIMENALEAMPRGGKLAVHAKQKGDHILIEIVDTGPGIEDEHLDSIYDPFFTSKTRGAGMGLTMVHQITKNHEGEITVRSVKGKGTTVTLSLPVRP